jgi:hypothetical protein
LPAIQVENMALPIRLTMFLMRLAREIPLAKLLLTLLSTVTKHAVKIDFVAF